MKRNLAIILLSASLVWGTSGCATIFNPGPDLVRVSSKPSGAMVSLDGMEMGKTPLVVPVPRSSEGVFTFDLPGYERATVDRDRVVNGVFFVNLGWAVFWPAIPVAMLVDIAAGNVGKYSTAPLQVDLVPIPVGGN